MNVRFLIACLWVLIASSAPSQTFLTNYPVADTFVRSLDPTHNYGGAGALSVSGSIATNVIGDQAGLLDSFMRFDISTVATNFNSIYGTTSASQPSFGMRATIRNPCSPSGRITAASPSARYVVCANA